MLNFDFTFLVFYGLAVYSLTFGYIESEIAKPFRYVVKKLTHEKLTTCYHCVGFWISINMGIFTANIMDDCGLFITTSHKIWHILLLGLYGGIISYFLHLGEELIIMKLEK